MRNCIRYMATILCTYTLLISLAEAQESKRYEVDGVAIGDKLEDVLKSWKLSDSDATTVGGRVGQMFMKSSSKTKLVFDHSRAAEALTEWNKTAPRKRKLDDVKKGNAVYKATFDFNDRLSSFTVIKTFNQNLDVKPIYEKVRAKYGTNAVWDKRVIHQYSDEAYSKYSPEDWENAKNLSYFLLGKYVSSDVDEFRIDMSPANGKLHFNAKEGAESRKINEAEIDKVRDELVKKINKKYPAAKTNIDDVQF